MDDIFTIMFILMLVFTFLEDRVKKKNQLPPPSPPSGDNLGFKIPTLENDPNMPVQVTTEVVVDNSIRSEGVTNNVTENYRRRYEQQRRRDEARARIVNREDQTRSTLTDHYDESADHSNAKPRGRILRSLDNGLVFTQDDTLDALVMSEIFGKPKAYRRR